MSRFVCDKAVMRPCLGSHAAYQYHDEDDADQRRGPQGGSEGVDDSCHGQRSKGQQHERIVADGQVLLKEDVEDGEGVHFQPQILLHLGQEVAHSLDRAMRT